MSIGKNAIQIKLNWVSHYYMFAMPHCALSKIKIARMQPYLNITKVLCISLRITRALKLYFYRIGQHEPLGCVEYRTVAVFWRFYGVVYQDSQEWESSSPPHRPEYTSSPVNCRRREDFFSAMESFSHKSSLWGETESRNLPRPKTRGRRLPWFGSEDCCSARRVSYLRCYAAEIPENPAR